MGKSTTKTIGTVMIIMVISRLFALVSNQVYMTFYGVNTQIEIYSYVITLPNIIFNCVGTALSTIVIPIFAGYIAANDKKSAERYANNIMGLAIFFSVLLAVIGIVLAPVFIYFTRFRYEEYRFAVSALRLMFPIVIFYSSNYIFQGILQSLGNFNMPALVSVPGSILIICYVMLFGEKFGVRGLLCVTFIGLALQAIVLIPSLIKADFTFKPLFNYKDKDVKRALNLIPAIIIGTSAYQINMLFNVSVAANFKDAVAIITLVQNIILYAFLALIYSVTSVMFPKLTMVASKNNMEQFRSILSKTLIGVLFIILPLMAGFIMLGTELIDLIYGWGKMTPENIRFAGVLIALYSIGICGIGVKEIIDRVFYSLEDTKKPAKVSVIIMIINIVGSLILTNIIGVYGIPIAYSISALIGAAILGIYLKDKIGEFLEKEFFKRLIKIIVSTLIMVISIIIVQKFGRESVCENKILEKFTNFFLPTVIGGSVYFISICCMDWKGIRSIIKNITGRKKD